MSFTLCKGVCCAFFIIYSSIQSFGQNDISFKHRIPQLNNKTVPVSKTVQDSLGNIWMTSSDGILKYNGYSYSLIKNEEIFASIAPKIDSVYHIYVDCLKNIWIISRKGFLIKYDSKSGAFNVISEFFNTPISSLKFKGEKLWILSKKGNVYTFLNKKRDSITTIPNINGIDNRAENIEFGNKREIYISTSKGKIYNYSLKTKKLNELVGPFTNYPTHVVLQADNYDKLWIGTEAHGLLVYDIHEGKYIQNKLFKENEYNINKELFINLFLDSNDYIWGGTDGDGLYKINTKSGKTEVYKKNSFNNFSISSNTILHVNEDKHENIWIVNKYGSIDIITRRNKNVNYVTGSVNNIPTRILSILKAKNETLWVGTDGNGLTKIDKDNFSQQYFNQNDNGFYTQSIVEDNEANIWIGTYKNGLWHYDHKNDTFKQIPVSNNKNQKATDIRTVFKDSRGRIWVGSNVSLNIFNSNLEQLISFNHNENGLSGVIVESFIEDKNQNIWFGMFDGGLFRFNENINDLSFSSFTNFKNHNNLSVSRAFSLSIGNPNELWMINDSHQLLSFNIENLVFNTPQNITQLKNQTLTAIAITDPNNLWLSSTRGIHHLDRKSNSIRTFYTTDGFQNDSFMQRSVFKDSEGILYFGNVEGVNFFDPKKLTKEKSNPQLFISSIEVLNKPAKFLLQDQIKSNISNLESLDLKNNQSSFSVKFSVMDDVLNTYYNYSYRLNGFDNDWKTTYSEGLATYTNIPPGKYTLEMRVNEVNKDSIISRKKITINIEHPFWNKPIAYILYIILLSVMTYVGLKWYSLRKKLLINKISRHKENELYEAKMNFYTKMSHEIQTPITLILGPIEDMLKRAEVNGNLLLKERLNIISNNANRLSRIARELTLTRNKELNKLKLSITKNDLYNDITNICSSFQELARSKKIDFSINCPKNLTNAWYDKEKLEHVLYNLLSNAFKFTPSEGNVQLAIAPSSKKSYVKIFVSDSGSGINENELNNIFKIFYRSKNNKEVKGAGIGLALTKELVHLHKGKIKVKSTPGEGTTFTVKLPISEDSYSETERITSSEKSNSSLVNEENIITKQCKDFDNSKKTILIVEDNFELQQFLKDLLVEQYTILLAENGKEGFYHAKNNIPDLILSDIMMPEMDGIEMCKELNKNELTKHIPVILLTAKNSTKAKIEGLKTGAIEYINKPFNTNELLLKVDNILTSKENIILKYRKELINKPEIKINKSQDELFLEKLVSNVNSRLKDSNFKVDELVEILNMSYSSLYRKCLALTGQNLIDFIRLLRLKKAAILLVNYGYTISEVAYMVGFNDPKYFSKSFKNQFNITPKEFKNKAASTENTSEYLKNYNIDTGDFTGNMNI